VANFFSRNIGRIWRVAEVLEYGILGINEGTSRPRLSDLDRAREGQLA
jgi:succinate-semialdehyde dehydrogenase/glutarate-semialdehyde dehydrogenase